MSELDQAHDGCAFCRGQEAAYRGDPSSANPFSPEDVPVGSTDWYETDFGLWEIGHRLGAKEPDGGLRHEQEPTDERQPD